MNQERLRRIRNIQSADWYETIVMRPLAIAFLVVFADVKVLTPNRATTLSNLFKLGGAALIPWGNYTHMVIGVVLIQIGVFWDHVDGQLARYRRSFSAFGSFYDKISDGITWTVVVLAIGWLAFEQTGDPLMLVLTGLGSSAQLVMGYMKWVYEHAAVGLAWHQAKADPAPHIAKRTKAPKFSDPPVRSRSDWLRWFAVRMAQVVRFQEMDLYFWAGLFLILDRAMWLVWLLVITQGAMMLYMLVKRMFMLRDLDRELGPLRAATEQSVKNEAPSAD